MGVERDVCDDVFDIADTDKSNSLEMKEFVSAFVDSYSHEEIRVLFREVYHTMAHAFKEFDRDHNYEVSKDEFSSGMQRIGINLSNEELTKLFGKKLCPFK